MWKSKNIKVYYGYHYTNYHKNAICKASIFPAMAV